MRYPIGQRQFLEALVAILSIDGSAVTTTLASTGLLKGQYFATIKKGTGADSNLVTIEFQNPLGMIPVFFTQMVTADCEVRPDAAPTKTGLTLRTLKSTNLATGVDDADFYLFLFGTEQIREGYY